MIHYSSHVMVQIIMVVTGYNGMKSNLRRDTGLDNTMATHAHCSKRRLSVVTLGCPGCTLLPTVGHALVWRRS